jgi:hypothetical protein
MQEVQDSYANESWAMDCDHVAKHLLLAIEQNLTYREIISSLFKTTQ